MSYARMEGLVDFTRSVVESPRSEPHDRTWHEALETRTTERWLVTIFLAVLGCLLALELALG